MLPRLGTQSFAPDRNSPFRDRYLTGVNSSRGRQSTLGVRAMATEFSVEVRQGVVVVTYVGKLEYAESNKAIAAGAEAAVHAGTRRLLFDVRRADLANYYSHIVRHAEFAPELGLDTAYQLAFVGLPEAAEVLEFAELVTRNRGWNARHFLDFDAALAWLTAEPQSPVG